MKIGSLVECVYRPNGGQLSFTQQCMKDAGYKSPQNKNIYTVRGFTPTFRGIYLEEIINPPLHTVRGYREVGFSISAFRELQPPMDLTELLKELQTA